MAVRWPGKTVDPGSHNSLSSYKGMRPPHWAWHWEVIFPQEPQKARLAQGPRMVTWAGGPASHTGLQARVSQTAQAASVWHLPAQIPQRSGASSHPRVLQRRVSCLPRPESWPPPAHAVTGSWKSLSVDPSISDILTLQVCSTQRLYPGSV